MTQPYPMGRGWLLNLRVPAYKIRPAAGVVPKRHKIGHDWLAKDSRTLLRRVLKLRLVVLLILAVSLFVLGSAGHLARVGQCWSISQDQIKARIRYAR
jgi:hypothetical protein